VKTDKQPVITNMDFDHVVIGMERDCFFWKTSIFLDKMFGQRGYYPIFGQQSCFIFLNNKMFDYLYEWELQGKCWSISWVIVFHIMLIIEVNKRGVTRRSHIFLNLTKRLGVPPI